MGKRGRRHGRFQRNKKTRSEGDGRAPKGDGWEDHFAEWVYTNDNFIKYYQAQGVVPLEEWETFMTYLAKPLPTTFRINNACAYAERIRERIEKDFKFDGLVVDDEEVAPISTMPWYPNKNGFQWSVDRRRIRKLPILAEFQKWLVELSDCGSITRQEAVSMIPPLVLDVEPHHKVLDMCAAPGSKTSQLLESLHAQEVVTGETPTGMVVANDVDLKRAYMLVHQSKRMGSPALVVTCHEAQNIPFLGGDAEQQSGFFDRVLCDAPCSGDGTLRKNPIIWKQWDAKNGIALHPLQVDIAKRGVSLLKVGGYMCYSTCTFNPLENEAVVAELLRWSNGALELVDVTDRLPLLKRRPGISSWKVLDSELHEYKTYEEFANPADPSTRNPRNRIKATMFPPSEEEAATFHLDRCMRCVPHDENTGGFFICLLKKVGPTPVDKPDLSRVKEQECVATEAAPATAEPLTADVDDASAEDAAEQDEGDDGVVKNEAETASAEQEEVATPVQKRQRVSRREQRKGVSRGGEQYVAFGLDQYEQVKECYGFDASFSPAQLITRSDEAKVVTYVSKSITMPLLEEMRAKGLKVVYTGTKMFERTELANSTTTYRLCQAGLNLALPFISKRKIQVSVRDLQMALERQGEFLDFDDFEPTTKDALMAAPLGSVICTLDRPQQTMVERMMLNMVLWRGRSSINTMATKADAVSILSTLKELNLYDPKVHDEAERARAVSKERQEQRQAAASTTE